MDYVTCERRKNSPHINVLICEKKCQHRNTCSAYLSYAQVKSIAASLGNCITETDELLAIKESPRHNLPSAAGKGEVKSAL
jgi:hypothetical protein